MATAYAAVTSLMHLMGILREHPHPQIEPLDEEWFGPLKSVICFFQKFLEDHHRTIDLRLETRIADASHAAEDLIEAYIVDRVGGANAFGGYFQNVIAFLDDANWAVRSKTRYDNRQGNNQFPESAYVALTSSKHIIEQIKKYPFTQFNINWMQHEIHSLLKFCENHNNIDDELARKITNVAHHAREALTDIANRIHAQENFYEMLQRVIANLYLIKDEAMEINEDEQILGNKQSSRHEMRISSSESPLAATFVENIFVGIEGITIRIMETLTHEQTNYLVSISGMGGIGKTTVALKVSQDPLIKSHFLHRAWVTVSKDYHTKEILVELLYCLDRNQSKESLNRMSENDLREKLHKSLFGRRYLVVLDDVWDIKALKEVKSFLPANKGSRILITTREKTVASITPHGFGMNTLDHGKSWELFCKKVFGKGYCPQELECIGRTIAYNCKGLPLSIVVIGGHLEKSPRTQEYWEFIAQNISSIVNSEDGRHYLKTLSLSYNNLPVHLKPCFLYLGIFPEDEEIWVDRLIRLWVAEGFVKPINGKNLEEAAQDYLYDLIGRHLISASKSSVIGKITTCKIHDLLRDFCIKEASEKNFFFVVLKQEDAGVLNNKRRIVHHPSAPYQLHDVLSSRIRTFIFKDRAELSNSSLLRVLAPVSTQCLVVPPPTNWIVNTRYIDFFNYNYTFSKPPSSILLWSLQYLFIQYNGHHFELPEFWKMPQLRDINVGRLILPHPPIEGNNIMKNLQSAQKILNFNFSEEAVKRIPNVKELKVAYNETLEGFDEGVCSLNNINHLKELESFGCFLYIKNANPTSMFRDLTFPRLLRFLDVNHFHWDDVTTKIASLPLLEELKLRDCEGREWNLPDEVQFGQLKSLELVDCCSLREFKADNDHFPCLRSLVLNGLSSLEEISPDIADIYPLTSVELIRCGDKAVESAKEIADKLLDDGYEELHVTVVLIKGSRLSPESLSACNFHVDTIYR